MAEGFGAVGLRVESADQLPEVLAQAKAACAEGKPVLINCHIGKTEFRKGSISM